MDVEPRSPLPDDWAEHFSEQHGRYFYEHVPTRQTQWERPVAARPVSPPPPPPPPPLPADAYSAVARRSEDRDASETIMVRRACNVVKDALLRTAVTIWKHVGGADGVEIVDMACGRGGDFGKFKRIARDARVALCKVVGADVAPGAVEEARRRWDAMAGASTRGGVVVADLANDHAARAIHEACLRDGLPEVDQPIPGEAHVVSCMFAMHYFFRDERAFNNFVMGAGWLLRAGGMLVVVYADGERVVDLFRRARAASKTWQEAGGVAFKVGDATLRMHTHAAQRIDDAERGGVAGPPFGLAYDFHLPGAVENVTEFVVHTPTRNQILEMANLLPVVDEPATALVRAMLGHEKDFWRDAIKKNELDITDAVWDHLALYRAAIFVKDPKRDDLDAARAGARRLLGF